MSLCINSQCQKSHNSDTIIFCQGCGSELLIDGRYRVLKELGQGGFGTTYEAIDLNSRPWVLKVLTDNHPKYVELFRQEAQVLSSLQHSGIPRLDADGYFTYFPANQTEPMHCLVMEKIEGLNLSQYIKQRQYRPIKPKRALRWLAELSLILDRVHGCNFFHRDIKPANIMLRSDGCLTLIDFGTARQVTNSYIDKQALGAVTGVMTQGYTPIEQMRGKAVFQSDFYALGGTMIFLMTARNPGEFYDVYQDKFCWREAVPDISTEFADLVDVMMAFSPKKRPKSAREIFAATLAIDSSLRVLAEHLEWKHQLADKQVLLDTTLTASDIVSQPVSISNIGNLTVDADFAELVRKEVAEIIGPMANIICQRILKQNPQISKADYCAKLISSLPTAHAKTLEQKLNKAISL